MWQNQNTKPVQRVDYLAPFIAFIAIIAFIAFIAFIDAFDSICRRGKVAEMFVFWRSNPPKATLVKQIQCQSQLSPFRPCAVCRLQLKIGRLQFWAPNVSFL